MGSLSILPTSLLLACVLPGASLPCAPWTVLCYILGDADAAGFCFLFCFSFFFNLIFLPFCFLGFVIYFCDLSSGVLWLTLTCDK